MLLSICPCFVLLLCAILLAAAPPEHAFPTLGAEQPKSLAVPSSTGSNESELRLVQARHGTYLVDASNDIIDKILLDYGEFDEEESIVFSQIVPQGGIVLEIAANMGPYTLLLSRLVGSRGVVHAVEPNPLVVHQLHAQLALNRVINVAVHNVAIGSNKAEGAFVRVAAATGRSGAHFVNTKELEHVAEIGQSGRPSCSSSTSIATCVSRAGELEFYSRVTTVDSLRLPWCNVMKLDAEGNELEILLGAGATINRSRPLIYAEDHHTRVHLSPVVRLLKLQGYLVYLHTFKTLMCREPKPGSRPCDYEERSILAVPQEKAASVLQSAPILKGMTLIS